MSSTRSDHLFTVSRPTIWNAVPSHVRAFFTLIKLKIFPFQSVSVGLTCCTASMCTSELLKAALSYLICLIFCDDSISNSTL